jgi:Cu2+-exporting ATPase
MDRHKTESHHSAEAQAHDHAHHVEDFRRRFWISLALTVPILALSHMFWELFGLRALEFPGSPYVLFVLSSAVFFYGGWPFLKGLADELRAKNPGMMTLIAVAITVAYAYSSAVVFGLAGTIFFWELATLIDIMLLGHWLEMRSVMSASRALEELAKLLPAEAHLILPDGSTRDVPVSALTRGALVLVKPGEKIPAGSCQSCGAVVDHHRVGERRAHLGGLAAPCAPGFRLRAGTHGDGDGDYLSACIGAGSAAGRCRLHRTFREEWLAHSQSHGIRARPRS